MPLSLVIRLYEGIDIPWISIYAYDVYFTVNVIFIATEQFIIYFLLLVTVFISGNCFSEIYMKVALKVRVEPKAI